MIAKMKTQTTHLNNGEEVNIKSPNVDPWGQIGCESIDGTRYDLVSIDYIEFPTTVYLFWFHSQGVYCCPATVDNAIKIWKTKGGNIYSGLPYLCEWHIPS